MLQAGVVAPSPAPHSGSQYCESSEVLRKPQANSFSCYKTINGVSQTLLWGAWRGYSLEVPPVLQRENLERSPP